MILFFGVSALFSVSRQAEAEELPPVSAPVEGESKTVPLKNVGDGNFQDYYHFGKISVELQAVKNVFQAGEEAKFSGFLINDNEYPIFSGQVYVQILQQNEKDSVENGDHLRDQFFVEKIIAFSAGESQPFGFSWKVPQNLPSDKYKAVFSFVVAKKYNMAGLSFVNNIYAGIAPFEIKNEPDGQSRILIDRSNVLLNGQKIIQRAFIPVIRGEKDVRYEVPIKNLSGEKRDIVLTQTLYYWDGLDGQNKISEKSETVTFGSNQTYIFKYEQKEISQPVYFLVLEARDGDAKSIINLRLGTDKNPRARINYSGLTKFPLKKGESYVFFTNFHSVSEVAASQNEVIVSLKDKKGKIIETLNYRGDIPGDIQLKKKELKADKNYDYLVINSAVKNKNGEIIDSASIILDAAQLSASRSAFGGDRLFGRLRNQPLAIQILIGGLLLALAGLLILSIYKKGSRGGGNGSGPNITGIVILLFLVFSYTFYHFFFRKQAGLFDAREVGAATIAEANTANTTVAWSSWWGTMANTRDPEGNGNCDMHQIQTSFSMSVNYLTYLGNNDYRADTNNIIPLGRKFSGGVGYTIGKSNADWIITGTYVDTPPAYFVNRFPGYTTAIGEPQDSVYNYTICKDDTGAYTGYQSRILLPVYIKQPSVSLTGNGSIVCSSNICEATSLGLGKVTVSIPTTDFKQYYLNTVYNSSGKLVQGFYYYNNPTGIVYTGQIPPLQKTFDFNVVRIVPKVDVKVNDSDGPVTIPFNTSAALTWTSSDAASCAASDGWSGTKSLSSYVNDDPVALSLSEFGATFGPDLPRLVDNKDTTWGWYSHSPSGAKINGWIKADFGPGNGKAYRNTRINAKLNYYGGSMPQIAVQYSDDDSLWTSAGTIPSAVMAATGNAWFEASWPDVGSHRYWRFSIFSSAPFNGSLTVNEIEFYTQGKAESTGNLTSSKTFTLTCVSSSGGSASDSATVNVSSSPVNNSAKYPLIVSKSGVGLGTVFSDLVGINCVANMPGLKPEYDINGNGVYDSDDASKISKIVSGLDVCPAGKICDINGNGTIGVEDAMLLGQTINYCSEAYTYGTQVTLSGLASSGSVFNGWSGGGCSGTGVCTVGVNSTTTVTAVFDSNIQTLSVDLQGSTNSTNWFNSLSGNAPLNGVDLIAYVSGTAQGTINYKFDCTNDGTWEIQADNVPSSPFSVADLCNYSSVGVYTTKARVERGTANPAEDTLFINITAPSSYSLNVTKYGRGTITSNPTGISFGVGEEGNKAKSYSSGASVSLTPVPDSGYNFPVWVGCDSVNANTCSITINNNRNVTATFSAIPSDFSLRALNGIYVTLAKGGSNTTDSSKTDVLVEPVWGFNKNVSLTASSGISGAVYSFAPQILFDTGYSVGSMFFVSVPNNTTPSTYPIIITGNAGGIIRITTVNINVETKDPIFIEI